MSIDPSNGIAMELSREQYKLLAKKLVFLNLGLGRLSVKFISKNGGNDTMKSK